MHRRLQTFPDRIALHGWRLLAMAIFFFLFASTGTGFADDFTEPPSAPTHMDSSLRLSMQYFHAARDETAHGRTDSALLQIRRGLEIDPDSSDLHLLRAGIEEGQSGQIRAARADIRRALDAGRFVEGSSSTALRRYAHILQDMHAWNELVDQVGTRISDTELLKYPELLASKIDALQSLGKIDTAQSLMEAGLARNPDNTALVSIALKYRVIPAAAAFLWFNRFHSNDEFYKVALFWYLYHLEPGTERLKRINEYISLGGQDETVSALGLQSQQSLGTVSAEDESQWLEKLLSRSGPIDLDAARLMAELIQDPANKKRLSDFLASPHLAAYRDYDHDGRYEEQMFFEAGHIVEWKVDSGQNDLIELDLQFKNDIPVHAFQQREGRLVSFDYAAYPELSRFVVQEGGIQIEYLLPHRAQDLRIVDIPDGGITDPLNALDVLKLQPETLNLDPSHFSNSAWLSNEYRGTGSEARIQSQTRWEKGIPLAQRIDSNDDGHFDTLYWFDQGIRVMGFRDIEESGIFSVVELYSQGKLSQVTFVSPDKGYSYVLKPSSGLAKWDLNHDHRIDVKEMQTANAWLFQEFNRGSMMQPLAQGIR